MQSTLQFSITYAKRHWRILPLKPGSKLPAVSHGVKDATDDISTIEAWWKQNENYNVGIATGRESGIIILDADSYKADCQFSELIAKYGTLPETLTAKTGRGGTHYYFRYPTDGEYGNKANLDGFHGVDVRADGGYVVGPPSIVDGNSYTWSKLAPIAQCPPWLLNLISKNPTSTTSTTANPAHLIQRAQAYLASVHPAIEGQGGDTHTMQTAGHVAALRCNGESMGEREIFDVMQDWNSKCSPPWSPRDLKAKIHSALHSGTPRKVKECDTCGKNAPITTNINSDISEDSLMVTNWDNVQGDVEWLWQGKIPYEGCTLIAAEAGVGKSQVSLSLGAAVSTGGQYPDHTTAPLGDVIIFSAEDADKVVKSRLERLGADLNRVHKVDGRKCGNIEKYFDLRDITSLQAALQKWPETKVVIIDPVASYADGVNTHQISDVRSVLKPLTMLATKHKLAVILVCHFSKDGNKSGGDRISGSTAWRDNARACWVVVKDADEENKRYFLPEKNNYAPLGDGFEFTTSDGHITWGEKTTLKLRDIEAKNRNVNDDTKLETAKDWLRERLASGAAPETEITKDAAKIGIKTWSLRQAKDALKVNSKRNGFGGPWSWSLPINELPIMQEHRINLDAA